MPVQLLKIIKGQSETPLPSHLQKENLQHLKEGCDHCKKKKKKEEKTFYKDLKGYCILVASVVSFTHLFVLP